MSHTQSVYHNTLEVHGSTPELFSMGYVGKHAYSQTDIVRRLSVLFGKNMSHFQL